MSEITVTKSIDAPVEKVFNTVADIRNFSQAVPEVVHVEYLSDIKTGVGTRFRETRSIKGREAKTELEVTEYVENKKVRIVSDTNGTIWDSVFTVKPVGEFTELKLEMEARAYKLLPRLMNPVIKGVIKKALINDMEAVKAFCES